ncbi:uncharacterized protein LOC122079850 isoform X2 [Macadamia integrifolia]|uniref:uncharacterized protein LOC122079850 isoform X2 n=1 Tax=Macadamia integrifolia TaxID=60698 RepID=UPI001C4FB46E|nr:uncharacterized protein LOC122079850 isoform X2 [Macadamia integrifolia]
MGEEMESEIRISELVHDGSPYFPLQDDDTVKYDDSRLKQLGYKQELSRSLSAISNFSVTFSIISVITGLTTTFNRPDVRGDVDNGLRMANRWLLHPHRRSLHGRDLLFLPDLRGPLLLERKAQRLLLGPFRFLAHWLLLYMPAAMVFARRYKFYPCSSYLLGVRDPGSG